MLTNLVWYSVGCKSGGSGQYKSASEAQREVFELVVILLDNTLQSRGAKRALRRMVIVLVTVL